MKVLLMLALDGLVIGILLVLLMGCEFRDPVEKVRSVEWYETYETERTKKLAECKENMVILDGKPDCVNASLAENNAQDAAKWQEESDKDKIRVEPLITQ